MSIKYLLNERELSKIDPKTAPNKGVQSKVLQYARFVTDAKTVNIT